MSSTFAANNISHASTNHITSLSHHLHPVWYDRTIWHSGEIIKIEDIGQMVNNPWVNQQCLLNEDVDVDPGEKGGGVEKPLDRHEAAQ